MLYEVAYYSDFIYINVYSSYPKDRLCEGTSCQSAVVCVHLFSELA